MSYVGRAWMAATVAAAQGRLFGGSGGDGASSAPSDPPLSCVRQATGASGTGDERRSQAEEAVRRAMFVSCWAPS